MNTKYKTTIEDLYTLPENSKAEIVNGEIVPMSPTGDLPSRAAGSIYISLRQYERRAPAGLAYADNTGFIVSLPHRQSFSPDAAFYVGPRTGGKFLEGAPIFAVEVRSEGDYGPKGLTQRELAAKRSDYFAAGTQVVWDVDVLRDEIVRVYRQNKPDNPTIYHRGEIAEAEPAVPGWKMPVNDLFA